MAASFSSDLEKAKHAQRIVKGAMTPATSKMFLFYLNLPSPESKYAWNKIISKQMESNPYVSLQGDTLEGPRGMLHQSFKDCVMFHLLTAFPINMAEQEKYHISNVLKKLKHVDVRQFVRQVESSSMPTLLRCHASTTARTQLPAPNPRTFRSRRLS
jgi:hypothetical protein